ncbi:hypothetical protein NHX12_031078 [Muraenolepis orangiensis]|uniref:Uncharacterized protein n=1 Tax=Muraenolepis orangiensis TaxID=630683 RepID=A0A9Q0EAS9_9TELE|nr:hypothetical protein NHX12_031078 [Muraenolepis orangiensis]
MLDPRVPGEEPLGGTMEDNVVGNPQGGPRVHAFTRSCSKDAIVNGNDILTSRHGHRTTCCRCCRIAAVDVFVVRLSAAVHKHVHRRGGIHYSYLAVRAGLTLAPGPAIRRIARFVAWPYRRRLPSRSLAQQQHARSCISFRSATARSATGARG